MHTLKRRMAGQKGSVCLCCQEVIVISSYMMAAEEVSWLAIRLNELQKINNPIGEAFIHKFFRVCQCKVNCMVQRLYIHISRFYNLKKILCNCSFTIILQSSCKLRLQYWDEWEKTKTFCMKTFLYFNWLGFFLNAIFTPRKILRCQTNFYFYVVIQYWQYNVGLGKITKKYFLSSWLRKERMGLQAVWANWNITGFFFLTKFGLLKCIYTP